MPSDITCTWENQNEIWEVNFDACIKSHKMYIDFLWYSNSIYGNLTHKNNTKYRKICTGTLSMAVFVLKSINKLDSDHQSLAQLFLVHPFSEMSCGHLIAMKSVMKNIEEQILWEKIRYIIIVCTQRWQQYKNINVKIVAGNYGSLPPPHQIFCDLKTLFL